jgi:uncharacterized repeat protein (TIGR01451 family)
MADTAQASNIFSTVFRRVLRIDGELVVVQASRQAIKGYEQMGGETRNSLGIRSRRRTRALPRAIVGLAQLAIIVGLFGTPTFIANVAAANPSASLDQCANDPAPSSHADGCSGSASDWVNGNLGASKSVYLEGDSIPYRLTLDNLSTGEHTVTIEWDTTQSGKHAIDYLTTFNRSVLDANPCLGVSGCNAGSSTTFAIPPDPQVTGAISAPGQASGNFTMYGGTITGVSAYSGGGLVWPAGNNSRSITITFTASVANPVLAWGGHIAQRFPDTGSGGWGLGNSAVAISGSPYHTRLLDLDGSGGNQDRSLSADAVIFPGFIHINKTATGGNGTFGYTASPSPLANCSITTSGGSGGGPDAPSCWFNTITDFKTYTINETALALNWTFNTLTCTTVSQNGGSIVIAGAIATIDLAEGEGVTCTYTNTLQPAAVTVTKTADASPVNAGDPIGFTVTVHNAGSGSATGVTLTDPLPGGSGTGVTWVKDPATGNPAAFTLAGAKGSQTLTLAGQPINLAPGATLSVHITAQTSAGECSTYNNTATVASTNDGGNPASASIVCSAADLHITKTADAASASAGDPIGYTVTVSNTGAGNATGVTLTDNLPGGNAGTPVSWAIDGTTGNPASFALTGAPGSQVLSLAGQPITLAAGQSLSVHVTAATSATSCATYTNSASLVSTNDGSPTVGPVTITVNCGALAITKTADAPSVDAGSPIGYLVTVTNTGQGALAGVTVSDTLPANGGLAWSIDPAGSSAGWSIAGGVLSFGPAPLPAGASVHVHITSPTTQATCGTVNNSAAASSANDGSPTVGPIGIVVTCPAIAIDKSANPTSLPAGGGSVTYTYPVTNPGNVPLSNVTVTDDKCAPVTYVSGDANSNSILETSETWTYTCTTTIKATTTNTATATGQFQGQTVQDTAQAVVTVAPTPHSPAIAIAKSANPTSLPAGGGSVTYTYTVTNPGLPVLSNVTVTDDKCAPVTYVSGDANGNSMLDHGETWTYTCTTTITVTTTNTATATGTNDGNTVSDTDQATVTVPTPTPTLTPTPTSTPTGSVGGATSPPKPPHVTLPPTDTEEPAENGTSTNTSFAFLSLLLVGLASTVWIYQRRRIRS